MKREILCIAAAALVAMAAAAPAATDPLYEQGRQLYNSNCRVCHIDKRQGDKPTAFYLRFRPPDFAEPSFWRNNPEEKIAHTLKKGKPPMPAFPGLTAEQVKALIHYLSRAFR
jgi:mono/diheme cytochrome c family protein